MIKWSSVPSRKVLSPMKHQNCLLGPLSFLPSRYPWLFSHGKFDQGIKPTTPIKC